MAATRFARPVRVRELLVAAVPGLRDRMLENTIRSDWTAIAGPDLSRRSRPIELRGTVLNVGVDNSAWLHEMTLRSAALLGALQARHGPAVTSLKFSLGEPSVPRPPEGRRTPPAPVRLSAEDERSVETIAATLADPALAAALRRLMTKDLVARRQGARLPPGESP